MIAFSELNLRLASSLLYCLFGTFDLKFFTLVTSCHILSFYSSCVAKMI